MLSYVIPAQETSASNGRPMTSTTNVVVVSAGGSDNVGVRQQVPSPPRNLSLRLNSQFMGNGGGEQHQLQQHSDVDALLANIAESCDERTHLLENDDNVDETNTASTPQIKRQNSNNSSGSNNNNSFSLNNNATNNFDKSCRALGGGGGGGDGNDDVDNINVSIDNDETLSDDAVTATEMTANALDSDVSDKQQSLQQQNPHNSNPRLTMTTTTTKKPKLSKLGTNKTVGLKRLVGLNHFIYCIYFSRALIECNV